jgi:hypothetical protein
MAKVIRLPGLIPTEGNGGIASPALVRKERRSTTTLVDRPLSSIICVCFLHNKLKTTNYTFIASTAGSIAV